MYISEHDKTVIRQVIEEQLQAFQQDDCATAFSLTSPAIQQKFENPENFMAMVKVKYPAVYCPRSVMFRGFTTINDYPARVAMVMGQDGNLVQAVYIMQHQRDRSWRIHGYYLVPVDEKIM
jgi:hypothetical protein